MSLTQYHKKRSFKDTPEPKGQLKKSRAKRLEFVVQKHHASHLHYDFRLEMDGVLKSWAVPKGPSLYPKDRRLAMMVEDHPFEYRKFEGTIPEGNYGAGNVIIWDSGWYELDRQAENWPASLQEGLKEGDLKFILHGEKLKGSFALIKTPRMGENAWLLIKHKDEHASKTDVTRLDKSVVSGKPVDSQDEAAEKTVVSARRAKMPHAARPMLATLTDEPFDDPAWIYEIKWDGYRAIGSWDGKTARLYSRNGKDFSEKYPPVFEALRNLKKPAVIDGEIVVLDEAGRSRFELLQNYHQDGGSLTYYVFDILWCDGHDLRGLPLTERKEILKTILPTKSPIRYSDHIHGQGKAFFKTAQNQALEGIMAKNGNSLYRAGIRTDQWLKVKTHLRQEAIICGFTEPRGSRKHIGALILGVYKDSQLEYVGHANAGSNTGQLERLRQRLEKIEIENSPFREKIRPNAPVHWVKPSYLAEVSFSEWTRDGRMRQPVFKGLRADKDPKEVGVEKPKKINKPAAKKTRLQFTHLDKFFWPERGYTKGDLIDYYKSISKIILPYLKGRPHNLLRQPNGYQGKSFFQKDMGSLPPEWVKTAKIYSESNGKEIDYMVCDSLDSLLYMVQLGCIEINPWNSRLGKLDKPDWAVLDLDPEDIGFKQVVKVAQVVRDVMEELKIPAYPKTSGKTGIHVFIPLAARYDYGQVKQFAEILANLVFQRTSGITSLERSPSKRQKRIYIDFLQNREGQTLAAPYSVRPTKDASVSAPLRWEEVNAELDPSQFTIKNIFKRLEEVGDLWQPVLKTGVDIAEVLKRLS
jgi:bifunctional non-homologous end joining protein LigD